MKIPFARSDRARRLILIASVLLLALTFAGSLLHHHEGGYDFDRCAVCHFATHIACVFVCAWLVLLGLSRRPFFIPVRERLTSLVAASSLQCRAPPIPV